MATSVKRMEDLVIVEQKRAYEDEMIAEVCDQIAADQGRPKKRLPFLPPKDRPSGLYINGQPAPFEKWDEED